MKSTLICMHIGRRSRLAYPKRTSSSDILLDFFLLRTKMSPPKKNICEKYYFFKCSLKYQKDCFFRFSRNMRIFESAWVWEILPYENSAFLLFFPLFLSFIAFLIERRTELSKNPKIRFHTKKREKQMIFHNSGNISFWRCT